MGIKYFFKWFRDSFPNTVTKYGESQPLENQYPYLLLLDLNGIIHTSCQKIYKYGSFEPKNLLKKSPPIFSGEKDLLVFEDVSNSINNLVNLTNPKEIVLCIDGIAPVSKQIQQRQRRFLSKKTNGGFDSNCISPGTDFLYKLGLYLKSQLEIKLESVWLNVTTIYFMDSLVPGEGEHKLYDFLRSNKTRIIRKKFNIVIIGNDADLIMLSLLVSTLFLKENLIYIIREDLYSKKSDYLMVDINLFKKKIFDFAKAKPNFKPYDFDRVVCDFVILCFLVGNDFLPQLPFFNIYDGGLDLVMKYYFTNPGCITFKSSEWRSSSSTTTDSELKSTIKINFQNLKVYFEHIIKNVGTQAIQHYKTREYGFPNILLDTILKKEGCLNMAFNHYLKSYSLHHKINNYLVKCYLREIDWVFKYYAYGGSTVDWTVYYPSQFAPTPIDILRCLKHSKLQLKNDEFKPFTHVDPFFQLLCILPPHSADLLPKPLDKVLVEDLVEFHPKEIIIDYQGKLNEWEGIPILPPLDYAKIWAIYKLKVDQISKEDEKRNHESKQLMISVSQSDI